MSRLLLSFLFVIACSRTSSGETPPAETLEQALRGDGPVTLLEGLPHPRAEQELYEREKAKPHRTIVDFAFYKDALPITAADTQAVRSVLTGSGALMPWEGEKKCGGFHPDYAIEVEKAGATWRVLICFGCGEARVLGGGGDTRYDLSRAAEDALEKALRHYRKNRPAAP